MKGKGGPRKTNPFVFFAANEAAGAPGITATRCFACDRYTLGRVLVCSYCLSREVELVAAGQSAELLEFAIVHHSTAGFEAPYAIGSIKTSEGMTMMGPVDGDVTQLKAGMALQFVTIPREGGEVIGFAYSVVKDRGA